MPAHCRRQLLRGALHRPGGRHRVRFDKQTETVQIGGELGVPSHLTTEARPGSDDCL